MERLSSVDPGHEEAGSFRMLVRANNVTQMREMLQRSPWLANAQGGWPLIEAASLGHVEATDLLLKAGAEVDARIQGRRPLMCAHTYPEVQRHLVEGGAAPLSDAEQETIEQTILSLQGESEDETAIVQALFRRDATAVRRLLDESPELVNSENGDRSLLHMAARKGYLEIVKLLVERGADLDAETEISAPTCAIPEDIARINGQSDVEVYLQEARQRRAADTIS